MSNRGEARWPVPGAPGPVRALPTAGPGAHSRRAGWRPGGRLSAATAAVVALTLAAGLVAYLSWPGSKPDSTPAVRRAVVAALENLAVAGQSVQCHHQGMRAHGRAAFAGGIFAVVPRGRAGGYYFLRAQVRLDAAGLRAREFFTNRLYPWSDIEDVRVVMTRK